MELQGTTFAQELYQELDSQKVTACLPVAHELASLQRDILALQAGMDILTIEEPWKASEVLSGAKPNSDSRRDVCGFSTQGTL